MMKYFISSLVLILLSSSIFLLSDSVFPAHTSAEKHAYTHLHTLPIITSLSQLPSKIGIPQYSHDFKWRRSVTGSSLKKKCLANLIVDSLPSSPRRWRNSRTYLEDVLSRLGGAASKISAVLDTSDLFLPFVATKYTKHKHVLSPLWNCLPADIKELPPCEALPVTLTIGSSSLSSQSTHIFPLIPFSAPTSLTPHSTPTSFSLHSTPNPSPAPQSKRLFLSFLKDFKLCEGRQIVFPLIQGRREESLQHSALKRRGLVCASSFAKNLFFHPSCVGISKKRAQLRLYMNAAPRGSVWEKKTQEVYSDPIKNLPWETQVPFFKEIKKGQDNEQYHFLKGEWTYLNHKPDMNRPAGVIEGGPERYDGLGLTLPNGVDRQRLKKFPYYLDHGVEWRQNKEGGIMKLDLHPDGGQEMTFGEGDMEFEDRQWGTWSSPHATEYFLETAWREPTPLWDNTGLPFPWSMKTNVIWEVPLEARTPAQSVPHPHMEWELAAYNLLGELIEDPSIDPIKNYEEQQETIKGLAEAIGEIDDVLKNTQRGKIPAAIKRRKLSGLLPPAMLSSVTSDNVRFYRAMASYFLRLLQNSQKDVRDDPRWKLNLVEREETPDHLGGGQWNCTEEEIEDKTIVFDNTVFFLKAYSNSYEEKMTKEEMAEMYHYMMTEMRGEGRFRDYAQRVAQEDDVEYDLQTERMKFPALKALYTPMWTMRQYGEEFGDALRPSKKLSSSLLTKFGSKLPPPYARLRNLPSDPENVNFLDEYDIFW